MSRKVSDFHLFHGLVSALALIDTVRGRTPEGGEAVDPAGKRRHKTALMLATVAVVISTAAVAIAIYTMVMLAAFVSGFAHFFSDFFSIIG